MSRAKLAAMLSLVQRDVAVFASYRTQVITQFLSAIFLLALFYFMSRLVQAHGFTPREYFGFVVVGLLTMRLMVAALAFVPMMLRQELVAGTFERLLVSPLGPLASIVAMTIFPLISAVTTAVVTATVAVAFFGFPIHWSTAFLALPTAVLIAVALMPVALILCASVLALKQRSSGSATVIALISLVGGFYFPIALLPGWLRWAGDVQPFTPALDLMRHSLLGTPLTDPALLELARVAGFTVVLGALALVAVRAAVDHGRTTGTILEY
jgi:ABC-2 type transport system permease protein